MTAFRCLDKKDQKNFKKTFGRDGDLFNNIIYAIEHPNPKYGDLTVREQIVRVLRIAYKFRWFLNEFDAPEEKVQTRATLMEPLVLTALARRKK